MREPDTVRGMVSDSVTRISEALWHGPPWP